MESSDGPATDSTRFVKKQNISRRTQPSASNASDLRPKALPVRIPSPPKIPIGTVKRSQSVRQPSTTAKGPLPRSHARQASTSNAVALKTAVETKNALQGPPHSRSRSVSSQMSGPADWRNEDKNARQETLRRSSRTVSSDRKAGTTLSSSKQSQADRQDQGAAGRTGKERDETSSNTSFRPAFSTSQKSYTPKKSSISSTSSGHRSALQNQEALDSNLELAQLHVIHSSSASNQAEWIESARQRFERQFETLVAVKQNLDRRDQDESMQKNAQHITEWMSQAGSDTLERRVKVVSKAIDDFCHLSAPGGRYTAIVEAFVHWFDTTAELRQRHTSNVPLATSSLEALGGLGDGWKAEVENLQDKLLSAAQDILLLGALDPEADLARCIAVLSEMLQNMLEELEALTFIEQSVVLHEQYWMQASIDRLSHGLHDSFD